MDLVRQAFERKHQDGAQDDRGVGSRPQEVPVMKHLLIVATLIAFNTAAFADNIPGFARITLDAAHRDTSIEGTVWYLAGGSKSRVVLFG